MAVRALERRRLEAVAGLVFVAVVAALGALGIFAANGAFADDYQLVALTERSGFGLDTSSDVKVRGITVGNVDAIDVLDDGTVAIVLNLRKELQVPETATASIEPVSVFGPKYVDLVLGPEEDTGPYLSDGDQLPSMLAPTEMAETLERVSVLLEHVDAERVGTTLNELARGLDGLGPQLGETIDAGVDLSARIVEAQPALEALVADAAAVAETVGSRADRLASVPADSRPVLELLATEGDALAGLLGETSQLSARSASLVADTADDLGHVLDGLGRGARVMHQHLAEIPAFNAAFRDVVTVLGDDALQWEVGDGRLGAITRAVVPLDPCLLFAGDLPGCAPVEAAG